MKPDHFRANGAPVTLRTKEGLKLLVERLVPRLSELRRPFLIEFSGTPKSGKTTCVEAISRFFRRNGVSVQVVTERASVCPVGNKKDMLFNVWTGAMSLAKMIEALEHRSDVVILDRGVFDSLVWMELHREEQVLTSREYEAIEGFFLLERFRAKIDLVIALSVEPSEALNREFRDQITDIPGSIMNPEMLMAYNACVDTCLGRYKDQFNRMLRIDTTSKSPLQGVTEIAQILLVSRSGNPIPKYETY